MRHTFHVLTLFATIGCGEERITSNYSNPIPPGPAPLAFKYGMVFREGDVCIDSATVRVVKGQALDRVAAQATPCDVFGSIGGWVLDQLTPDGLPMTIRASAPGYESRDTIVSPTLAPQGPILLTLRRLPAASPRLR